MVLAYHLVWVAYGWWLPNDPRGSTSHTIRNDVIADLGTLHQGRKKLQPASRQIRQFYDQARALLRFPLLQFSDAERSMIGQAFDRAIHRFGYTCYACAVMPDHVHLLIRRHRDLAEVMIATLQAASRDAVLGLRERESNHPVWGGPGWKVFEDTPDDVRRTIRYIEGNPTGARMPPKRWAFVTPYDGWEPPRVRVVR